MIMRFEWVTWKPPQLSGEAELQYVRALNRFGKSPFIKRFWGLSPPELPKNERSFFETHFAGLAYLGVLLLCVIAGSDSTPTKTPNPNLTLPQFFGSLAALGAIVFYGSMALAVGRYTAWLMALERKYSLPKQSSAGSVQSESAVSPHYETVAHEIDEGRLDKVTWTRAVGDSGGDEKVAKSLYIRYRVAALDSADAARTRAAHEAEVMAQTERAAAERASRQRAAEAAKTENDGCTKALAWGVGIILLIAVINGFTNNNAPTPSSAPVLTSQPTEYVAPSYATQRASLAQEEAELTTTYHQLTLRRATLDLNDPVAVEAFNRDAAQYTARAKAFREKKATSGQ